MAQEPNHGISYLMALKRNGSDAASAAAPARESSPETQPGGTGNYQSAPAQPSYHGAEKRRSPRYKCEGSAQMRELTAKSTPGRALPISAFTAARLRPRPPIPWEPVLQLKLEANGVKVEVTGNVRVSYPYLGMGIAFVNMTDENEARLRDMLSTILRPSVIMGPGIASLLPTTGPLEAVALISDPTAAIQALVEFFENREMLMLATIS
ncbi:MAG TPA: PilZ domain-containing protein [Candidatus Sulfotelmatobacter sp.]|nr:PilZ domain-containing protein [Candidatus Sulfotelmatobacter sp.]